MGFRWQSWRREWRRWQHLLVRGRLQGGTGRPGGSVHVERRVLHLKLRQELCHWPEGFPVEKWKSLSVLGGPAVRLGSVWGDGFSVEARGRRAGLQHRPDGFHPL